MCFEETGIKKFRQFLFEHSKWISYTQEKKFIVKKSLILNAGRGVFLKKSSKPETSGSVICSYFGEPLEQWYYEAIECKTNNYTGIKIKHPRLGVCIWRGIDKTLGVYINDAMKEKDANVEFVINWNEIDFKNKIIKGDNFINICVKKNCTIQPGDELLLFYGKNFWKFLKKTNEPFCCLCISLKSEKKNVMLLCDGCNVGFHQECLFKYNGRKEIIPKGDWFCFNCKETMSKKEKSQQLKITKKSN